MDPLGPELEEIRSLAQRSQGLVGELRDKANEQAAERERTSTQLGEEATQLIEKVAASIAGELSAEIAARHNEQQTQSIQQLRAERAAWDDERTEWESVRNQIELELTSREQQLQEKAASLAADAELLAQSGDTSAECDRLTNELAEQRRQSEERITALESEANSLRAQVASGQQDTAGQAEMIEKFDIALADLQAHRERVAELEDQLAARPEPGAEHESELAHLRQERDSFADRIQQLESQIAAGDVGSDQGEELLDLRARFEMAVEDVRQLKEQNADLEDRLSRSSNDANLGGGDDWEAQKRRLLAQLEGEGEPGDTERVEERATIAGTIQITDGVVAEKDREIDRLRQQLENRGPGEADETAVDTAAAALLADDEVIQAERERLAALENEWQDKLRQAELELSLERAKIARSQNEIAEQQMELETLRSAVERAAGDQPPGESRQNWFKKLGLGGDQT